MNSDLHFYVVLISSQSLLLRNELLWFAHAIQVGINYMGVLTFTKFLHQHTLNGSFESYDAIDQFHARANFYFFLFFIIQYVFYIK